MTLSALLRRRMVAPAVALLLCALVVGVAWACGGSTDSPDPTATQAPSATTAPDADPDPTSEPAATPTALSVTILDPDGRGWNVLGSADALVTVLDYSDFQ